MLWKISRLVDLFLPISLSLPSPWRVQVYLDEFIHLPIRRGVYHVPLRSKTHTVEIRCLICPCKFEGNDRKSQGMYKVIGPHDKLQKLPLRVRKRLRGFLSPTSAVTLPEARREACGVPAGAVAYALETAGYIVIDGAADRAAVNGIKRDLDRQVATKEFQRPAQQRVHPRARRGGIAKLRAAGQRLRGGPRAYMVDTCPLYLVQGLIQTVCTVSICV